MTSPIAFALCTNGPNDTAPVNDSVEDRINDLLVLGFSSQLSKFGLRTSSLSWTSYFLNDFPRLVKPGRQNDDQAADRATSANDRNKVETRIGYDFMWVYDEG